MAPGDRDGGGWRNYLDGAVAEYSRLCGSGVSDDRDRETPASLYPNRLAERRYCGCHPPRDPLCPSGYPRFALGCRRAAGYWGVAQGRAAAPLATTHRGQCGPGVFDQKFYDCPADAGAPTLPLAAAVAAPALALALWGADLRRSACSAVAGFG